MEKMKFGTRVNHSLLGNGTIDDKQRILDWLVMVKFDKDPPKEYNMGENPTVMFENELKIIPMKDIDNKKRELLEELSLLQREIRPIETKIAVVVGEILELGDYPSADELNVFGVREIFWENVL